MRPLPCSQHTLFVTLQKASAIPRRSSCLRWCQSLPRGRAAVLNEPAVASATWSHTTRGRHGTSCQRLRHRRTPPQCSQDVYTARAPLKHLCGGNAPRARTQPWRTVPQLYAREFTVSMVLDADRVRTTYARCTSGSAKAVRRAMYLRDREVRPDVLVCIC